MWSLGLVVMGKPFGGFDGNFMVLWAAGGEIPPADPAAWNPVLIIGAKQGDEATRISNDNGLVNFLHRGIHQFARTNPPAPSPATPPLTSQSEVRRHLRSRGSRGAW